MRGPGSLVVLLLSALLTSSAGAADTGITGQKIVLKVKGTTQKLIVASKDPFTPFPPIGSADDPSVGGATIELITPAQAGSLSLPGGTGTPGWKAKDGAVDSYTFKNGSVRSLTLKQGRTLKITGKNVPIGMTAPLGSVGVRLTMGGTRTCALFGTSSVVVDAPGNFTARASAAPADCTNTSLGGAAVCGDGEVEGAESCEASNDAACPGRCSDCTCDVCGNGVIEPTEACEPSDESACPGHCADCACEPYCGNDTIDPGEVCDGTAFDDDNFACTSVFGPACMADCSSCCSIAYCESNECCPGYICAPRIGPGVHQCRKPCSMSDGATGNPACDPGQVCMGNVCLTPYCTSDAQCSPAQCLGGVCCMILGGQFICQ